MMLKATILLLVVVGLVSVQGCQLPGKTANFNFYLRYLFFRVKIQSQTLHNKSWVCEEETLDG